jgi:DNA-binding LacI/PurR family transcriptional regulator
MKLTQNKKSYIDLQNDLRNKIAMNHYSIETAIKPEIELAKEYGISRTSARKAILNLVNEGVLERVQGRGTFIVPTNQRSIPALSPVSSKQIIAALHGYNVTFGRQEYDRALAGGIQEGCYEKKFTYTGFVENTEINPEEIAEKYRRGTLGGIIWERPAESIYPVIEAIHNKKVPQVMINRCLPGIPSIFFDSANSIRRTVAFLFGIGHEKIVFLDPPKDEMVFTSRQKAFIDELRKRGCQNPEDYLCQIPTEDHKKLESYDSMPKCTAIICMSMYTDYLLSWSAERGIIIPDDLSIFAMLSKHSHIARSHPEISVIVDPRETIGYEAVRLLAEQNNAGTISSAPIKINGDLIIRDSCLSPKKFFQYSNAN